MVAKREISRASWCRRNRIRTSDEGEPSLRTLSKNLSNPDRSFDVQTTNRFHLQDRENEENILKRRSGISRAFTESDFVIYKI
ncbi:unnamed protein product [Linum tenue]|uniref:Uncharacterized protein n=1 Tax=Linum tenue TaxID=586396 RepID=A0AAV0MJE2_9ROSI|nr:unnamed protein product [Linum tenue]